LLALTLSCRVDSLQPSTHMLFKALDQTSSTLSGALYRSVIARAATTLTRVLEEAFPILRPAARAKAGAPAAHTCAAGRAGSDAKAKRKEKVICKPPMVAVEESDSDDTRECSLCHHRESRHDAAGRLLPLLVPDASCSLSAQYFCWLVV
jgi:hypothetical protein